MNTLFSKQWFGKHQRKLLFFLNAPILRSIFRHILCIDSKEKIIILLPHAYIEDLGSKHRITFKTHNKYAKRLYYGLKPLWYVLHFFDFGLDTFVPNYSFGFSTLTAFPDTSTGATTHDTMLASSIAVFATARGAASASSSSAAANPIEAGTIGGASSNNFSIHRALFTFDTSAITSGNNISAAILSLFGTAKTTGLGTTDIHIVATAPTTDNNTALADYGTFSFTSFGSVIDASWSNIKYNDFTLNALGLSNVSKTGISRFGAISAWDLNNSFTGSWVSVATSYFTFNAADQAGTANDPQLVVTYAAPGPNAGGMMGYF